MSVLLLTGGGWASVYFTAVEADAPPPVAVAESSAQTRDEFTMPSLGIKIGDSIFTITLYDNASTRALLAIMPLTLDMSELNGNEKYFYLADSLPADPERVGNINAGDLMLYGSDCLVLFYKSFPTSYSYTKLGHINDASGLPDALGKGDILVMFAADG